jgi:hypothetical protein
MPQLAHRTLALSDKGASNIKDGDDAQKLTAGVHRILAYVERQLASSSPKTRKAAKGFLSKYSE